MDEESIVLSMIVYNSIRSRGKRLLDRVLSSSLQLPYEEAIIIDDGLDGTGRYVKAWLEARGKRAVILRSRSPRPTRSTARQTAIDCFLECYNQEWLFFLDDDAVLLSGWWREAKPYTEEPSVGMIWGVNWDPPNSPLAWRRPKDKNEILEYKIRAFEVRGGLHDSLIRREALRDLPRIPPALHLYEDAWIYWSLKCKGWNVKVVYTGVEHYGGDRPFLNLESARKSVLCAYRYGIIEEYRLDARKYFKSSLRALGIPLRPLVGFIMTVPLIIRNRDFKYYLRIQYNKFIIRYYQFLARLKYGPPPDTCEALQRKAPKECL